MERVSTSRGHFMRIRSLLLLLSVVALVCSTVTNLFSQVTATATLQGTVTDQTGAVVPGADVTATEGSTVLQRVEKSNGSGVYVFSLLPAGEYELRVAVKGFATGVFKNVDLFV